MTPEFVCQHLIWNLQIFVGQRRNHLRTMVYRLPRGDAGELLETPGSWTRSGRHGSVPPGPKTFIGLLLSAKRGNYARAGEAFSAPRSIEAQVRINVIQRPWAASRCRICTHAGADNPMSKKPSATWMAVRYIAARAH